MTAVRSLNNIVKSHCSGNTSAQDRIRVEHYVRDSMNAEVWVMRQSDGASDVLTITLPECKLVTIQVTDTYDDLEMGLDNGQK